MKTLSPAAMDAIERGDAVVSGAVEIYSPGRGPVGVPEATDVVLRWQQSGDSFFAPDHGAMHLAYFDAAGDQIGLLESPTGSNNPPAGVWTLRSITSSTPPGAVRLRIYMGISRTAGLDATQSFDGIQLAIGGVSVPLTNPGAEANGVEIENPIGWTAELGSIVAISSTTSNPGLTAYDGDFFFHGGINNVVSVYQDIYLSEIAAPEPGVIEPILRVWGGQGPIELDGEIYQGISDRTLAQQTAGAIGGFAQGMVLGLSRIEPYALELLDADQVRGGAVVFRRLIFGPDAKTLLDCSVWDRGRIDTIETNEVVGGEASIKVNVESAARGLGSSGGRMRSDSDQRLINPNDGYMRKVSYAGEKMLYWGGRKPGRTGGTTYIGSPASSGL